jgi:hypothetical protein
MADHVHDPDLADEIRGLTVKNGRIDHSAGNHDDTCISMLLAGYFVLFGKNLRLYGIDLTNFFNGEVVDGKIVDPMYKDKQESIAKRIGELRGLVRNTTNGMMKCAYERELKYLESQFDPTVLGEEATIADQVKYIGSPLVDTSINTFTNNFRRFNLL